MKEETIELLKKMMLILIYQVTVLNQNTGMGTLSKQMKIQNMFLEIQKFASKRKNSITEVFTYDYSMGIILRNTEEETGHTERYVLIISQSLETFKVIERTVEIKFEETIINFEQSKF
jgi:hypothetical protein